MGQARIDFSKSKNQLSCESKTSSQSARCGNSLDELGVTRDLTCTAVSREMVQTQEEQSTNRGDRPLGSLQPRTQYDRFSSPNLARPRTAASSMVALGTKRPRPRILRMRGRGSRGSDTIQGGCEIHPIRQGPLRQFIQVHRNCGPRSRFRQTGMRQDLLAPRCRARTVRKQRDLQLHHEH